MSQQQTTVSKLDLQYFNQYTDGYSPYTPEDLHLILADLIEILSQRSPRRVCEVGAADGQFSAALKKWLPGETLLLGVDIAAQVLRLYPYHKLCGSAFNMPVADSRFDLMCYVASLHHLWPFQASLVELNRMLAPGGAVYFLEPNFFHPQRRFVMNQQWLYRHYRQANDKPVNPEELEITLIELGFEVIQKQYINLHFKSPGLLQMTQNVIARLPWPKSLERYVMSWFILIGVKS